MKLYAVIFALALASCQTVPESPERAALREMKPILPPQFEQVISEDDALIEALRNLQTITP